MSQQTWMLIGIILTAGLVQGISGFGFGLFAMGVMVLLMPTTDAVVIVAFTSLASIALNVWSISKETPGREVWPIIATAIPTSILGVLLLEHIPAQTLRVGIAIMILVGCAVSLWQPNRALIRRAFPSAYLVGLTSGFLGGLLNMGGPPIVLYALLRGWDKNVSKGVISATFLATGILRVLSHLIIGTATWPLIRQSLLLMIPTLAASYLGILIFRRLSTRSFRYAVTGLLVLLALRVILP